MLTQTALTPLSLNATASGLSNALPIRFYGGQITPLAAENKELPNSLKNAACMVESLMNPESLYKEKDDTGLGIFDFPRCLQEHKGASNIRFKKSPDAVQFDVPLTQSLHSRATGRTPGLADCTGVPLQDVLSVFECTKKENPAASNSSDLIPTRLPSPPLRDKNSQPGVIAGFPRSSVVVATLGTLGVIAAAAAVYLGIKKACDKRSNRQEGEHQPAQADELERLRNSESCV